MKRNLTAKAILVCLLIISSPYVFSGDASALEIKSVTSGDGLYPGDVQGVDLTFSVNEPSVLTAILTNQSDFVVTQFGFNVSSAVDGLTVTSPFPSGFSLQADLSMGKWNFDYGVKSKVQDGIAPGGAETFYFIISGTGSYTPMDFWVSGSPTAAIKVQAGPDGLSGYVATPEPGTLMLLGFAIGGLGILGLRRSKFKVSN